MKKFIYKEGKKHSFMFNPDNNFVRRYRDIIKYCTVFDK